ncbi:aldo-keto reductase 1 [Spatholobus suberectus]|nr:aldo-keto reductase 1 [Spatholobus suberectus]
MAEAQTVHIPRAKLGTQGLEFSKLGLGCMSLSGAYNDPLPEEEGISVFKHAFSQGITFFDTADVYGANANEVLLGKTAHHPRFLAENIDKNKSIYDRIESLAKKHQCTPPQLALAWVLHQGDDVVPIPGTTKTKNPDQNIGALSLKFTESESREILSSP